MNAPRRRYLYDVRGEGLTIGRLIQVPELDIETKGVKNPKKCWTSFKSLPHATHASTHARTLLVVLLLYALNYACARFTTAITIIASHNRSRRRQQPQHRRLRRQWTIKYNACSVGQPLSGPGERLTLLYRGCFSTSTFPSHMLLLLFIAKKRLTLHIGRSRGW